jgi:hypothetical protein
MSLITAVNNVCDVVNIDGFDSVFANTDAGAQTMVELAQEAGDEIARRADWKALLAQSVLATSPATLPADFQRFAPGGALFTAGFLPVRPVTNSGQWVIVSTLPSIQPYYFLSGNKVQTSPPSAAIGATLYYLSKNWIASTGGMTAAYQADDDTAVFPERLLTKNIIWRWLRKGGLSYSDELAEFEADLVQEINADRGAIS